MPLKPSLPSLFRSPVVSTPVEKPLTETRTETPVAASPTAPDQFEARPSSRFVNHLLGLDTNADGRLTRDEIGRGEGALEQLSSDSRGNDRVESALMLQIREAQQSSDATATVPVEYTVNNEGQLVFSHGERELASFAHDDANNANLPATLLEGTELQVVHGDDPGDFYCEHMLFSSQQVASAPNSSVLENKAGETLTGFLHVPSDDFTRSSTRTGYELSERHAATSQVVGAALRGYTEDIAAQNPEGPIRLLVTGYDQFSYVRNNPTGEFVSHRENLDAAMQSAFGDALLTKEGVVTGGVAEGEEVGLLEGQTLRYEIRDPQTGEPREIQLSTHLFPVDDRAISPTSEGSIQSVMERLQPQAVLSMGVAGEGSYKAEHRADSGGLQRSEEGEASHDWNASGNVQLRDNFSLARAIHNGSANR